MKKILLSIITVFLLTNFVMAKELRIGVVDLQEVVRSSEAGKEALAKLQKKFDTLRQQLQAKEEELRKFKEELERKAPLLSIEARQEKERQYQKMLREYQAQREDAQYEMRQAEQKALQPILKDLEQVVKQMAEKEGYDIILEKKMPGIYWVSPSIDLTDHVVELYNQYQKTKKK